MLPNQRMHAACPPTCTTVYHASSGEADPVANAAKCYNLGLPHAAHTLPVNAAKKNKKMSIFGPLPVTSKTS